VPPGAGAVTGLAGRLGFGGGADGAEVSIGSAEAGLPQFLSGVPGGPGGLGGIGVADQWFCE